MIDFRRDSFEVIRNAAIKGPLPIPDINKLHDGIEAFAKRVEAATLERAANVAEEWAAQYPVEIFREPKIVKDEAAKIAVTRASAKMGRHSGTQIAAKLREMKHEG